MISISSEITSDRARSAASPARSRSSPAPAAASAGRSSSVWPRRAQPWSPRSARRTRARSSPRTLAARGASVVFVAADVRDERRCRAPRRRGGRPLRAPRRAVQQRRRRPAEDGRRDDAARSTTACSTRTSGASSRARATRSRTCSSSGGGSVVNIGSVAATVGFATDAAYCASKGAVHALTRQMALDYARDGVRVNCVAPGFIETEQVRVYIESHDDPAAAEREVVAAHPMGRMGRPGGGRGGRRVPRLRRRVVRHRVVLHRRRRSPRLVARVTVRGADDGNDPRGVRHRDGRRR